MREILICLNEFIIRLHLKQYDIRYDGITFDIGMRMPEYDY